MSRVGADVLVANLSDQDLENRRLNQKSCAEIYRIRQKTHADPWFPVAVDYGHHPKIPFEDFGGIVLAVGHMIDNFRHNWPVAAEMPGSSP